VDDHGIVNVFYRADGVSRTEPSTACGCRVTSSYFDAREVQRPKNNANLQSALASQVSQTLLILYKHTLTVYTLRVCMCVSERAGFQAYHQQTFYIPVPQQ